MRRLTVTVGALCVALVSSGAFAQVPPNPNNPNDTVPDAMPLAYEPTDIQSPSRLGPRHDRLSAAAWQGCPGS